MADMKESALTQQSDCKWVRALDSNGNSILISKEDLASVVGELLPKSDLEKDGLMTKGRSYYTYTGLMTRLDPYFNDLNNIYKYTERGLSIFRCNGDISNLPVQEGGLLEHIQRDDKNGSAGSQFIVQTYYSVAGTTFRRYGNGNNLNNTINYKEWEQIL